MIHVEILRGEVVLNFVRVYVYMIGTIVSLCYVRLLYFDEIYRNTYTYRERLLFI